MQGQPRSLDTWGAIASIVGFIASICMIVFTDYKVAALLSLLIAETVALLVWWHYCRKRSLCVHPYDREEMLQYLRYVFFAPTKMQYEVVEVCRVTQPTLAALPVKLTWSGRGTVRVKSALVADEIPIASDGQSGELSFIFPLPEVKRFGESFVTQYVLELEDSGQQNIPKLSKSVRRPCGLLVFEAVLHYKSECPPAQLIWLPLDNPSSLKGSTKIADIPFDVSTRSFRAVVAAPVLGRIVKSKFLL